VSLTDVWNINASTILGNGYQSTYLSSNGAGNKDLGSAYTVPQRRIWDQYAAMFDFYQVESVELRFLPFKWESTQSTAGLATVYATPAYCCIDPEATGADTPANIASYGNMTVAKPYAELHRRLTYHDLGLQKQDTLILKTNGTSASREQYTNAAQAVLLARSPNFTAGATFGVMVYTVHYVFSGQRSPTSEVQAEP